jgi:mannose-6-phosphate isomerase-like protein (cupin superfamily)
LDHHERVRSRTALDQLLAQYSLLHLKPWALGVLCPSGFRRVVIADTPSAYVSVQAFAAGQRSYAHTHPDSEEWMIVLAGSGEARFGDHYIPLKPGEVLGRGSIHPHAFAAEGEPLYLLSIQCPRPAEEATSWDETSQPRAPVDCVESGRCRGCPRCGGHSAEDPPATFVCENCTFQFR